MMTGSAQIFSPWQKWLTYLHYSYRDNFNRKDQNMIKFTVYNRFTKAVQFEAEIDCQDSESNSVKLGLAVKWAIVNNVSLRWVNLREAYLQWAYLRGANLQGVNLQGADLQGADLRGVDLQGANLQGANLRGVDLQWTDLEGANLKDAKL